MRFSLRSLLVLAPACVFLAAFAAPLHTPAQDSRQNQAPHPITSLPLPPDDTDTPAVKPPAPAIAPAPAKPTPTPRPSRRHPATSAPSTLPATPPTTVIVPATPVVPAEAPTTPSLTVIVPATPAPSPAAKTPSRRHGKKPAASTAPAALDTTPHAITGLPLPPDEEPAPKPSVPRPAPVAPAPAAPKPAPAAPTPKRNPEALKRRPEATPAPTEKPAPPTPKPAPTPAPKAPAPVKSYTPDTPASAPVRIEPIVPVTPSKPVPEPDTPAPVPAAPRPTAVEPQPLVPPVIVKSPAKTTSKPTPKVVLPPPTLKPRTAAPDKPSTVILPATPIIKTTSPTVMTVPPTPAPARPEEKPAPAPSHTVAPPPAGPSRSVSTVAPSPQPAGTLGAIVFQGSDPFTADELTPLTGLTLGTVPTEDSLQAASRQLIDTGYFFNVSAAYNVDSGVGTATFALQPAPANQLRRVSFANFVWLSPAEIADALKRVAFYHGYGSIPATNNSTVVNAIQSALERALTAKGVSALLAHSDVPPSALHPYNAIEFRVTDPHIVLESASLFDIPPALVTKTLNAQALAVRQPYNEGIAGTTLSDLLLRPARDAGFIGAKLWRIERKRKVSGNTIGVTFTARMDAGPLYTVKGLTWTPSPVYSTAEFHRNSGLVVGKVPTPGGLDKTRQSILDAYHAHGYVDAVVLIDTTLDAPSSTASYSFSVTPGPQYLLRTIKVLGLSPDAQKAFDANWAIKPGDIYNEDYLLNFLNIHQNVSALKGYTFDYNRSSIPDSHMIDLSITFRLNQ